MSVTTTTRLPRAAMAIVLATVAGAACGRSTDPTIQADGVMELSVGGCYRIVTAKEAYQPLELPAEFAKEGLAVHFEARLMPTFNTCQAGTTVEMVSIRRIGG